MSTEKIKPAIVAVGYNRPDSLKRLLESVEKADYPSDDIELIVSIDCSANQSDVVKAAEDAPWTHGNKTVRAFPERQGLRKHVIQCGDLSEKYGAVIILEDDLFVSPSYYHYACSAANRYKDDSNICGTALYSHSWSEFAHLPFTPSYNGYDVFCCQFSITWGQCWTAAQWNGFKSWYSENEDKFPAESTRIPGDILRWGSQSWGKYFVEYMVESGKYYIIPYVAMTTNFSEAGQHSKHSSTCFQVPLTEAVKTDYRFPDFEEAVKYDTFFERVFPDSYDISGIPAKDICVNLNGIRPSANGKKYILTTKRPSSAPIASFGMLTRPIESNVTFGIAGDDIFLCKAESDALSVDIKHPGEAREAYELRDLYWGVVLRQGIRRAAKAVKDKLFRR